MSSSGPFFSISGTPTITAEKLNGKNYLSWSASVELWFLGQGYHDHLEKDITEIPSESQELWKKLDFQLCALLWQSVEPNILGILRTFKTCHSFWKKAQTIFANDIQRLYDSAHKLASLKQTDDDMVSFIAQAQSAAEELKMFLEADSVEEMKKKLDKLCMVLILRAMNSNFNHIRDQILTDQEIPSMENLVTRLLRVPSSKNSASLVEPTESSAMVSTRGRGGHGNRGGRGGRSGVSSTLFKSPFASGFSFGTSATSVCSASLPTMFSSTNNESTQFPFTSAAASTSTQPAFGSPNPVFTVPVNNDQMSMDSMTEDKVQATPRATPIFGQQPAPVQFVGSSTPLGASPFQFGCQQTIASENPSPFQASGSFLLGSGGGGGDKSGRKFVKIKHRPRRK